MPNLQKEEPVTRPGLRGALFYLGHFGAIAAFIPFLNVYFVQHVGLSGREVGLLAALMPLTTLVCAPAVSAVADRFRWRVPILKLALAGLLLGLLSLRWAHTFSQLFGLMLLLAAAYSPVVSISDALIARMAARYRLNLGNMRLWGSLSFALIAIACGALWQQLGYRPMFLFAAALVLPVIWFAHQLEETPAVPTTTPRSLAALAQVSGLPAVLTAAFLAGITLGFIFVFDGIYMAHLGGNEIMVGLIFGIAAATEPPMMQISDGIIRRLRGPRTLLLAFTLLAIVMVGYILVPSPEMLLVFAAVRGLGFGLFLISTIRLVDALAPPEWSSTAQSLRNAGTFGLAPLIAGPLGGLIFDTASLRAIFALGLLAITLAVIVIVHAMRRRVFDTAAIPATAPAASHPGTGVPPTPGHHLLRK